MALIHSFSKETLEEFFHRLNNGRLLIVNELNMDDSTDLDRLEDELRIVFTTANKSGTEKNGVFGDKATLDIIPRCNCGVSIGNYKKDTYCKVCNTLVTNVFDQVEPTIWFDRLEECGKFIAPHYLTMVREALSMKNVDILYWISDRRYNPDREVLSKVSDLISGIKQIAGFKRSYTWLVDNFDKVLFRISEDNSIRATKSKYKKLLRLMDLWNRDKDYILTDKLPMLPKRLFLMEVKSKGTYGNISIPELYNISLSFAKSVNGDFTKRDNAMGKLAFSMSDVYKTTVKRFEFGKKKLLRKHIYGTRCYFTARSVIVSKGGSHDHRFIELPWGIAITLMRPHILNKLSKLNYRYLDAVRLIQDSVNQYNQVLDGVIRELIKESFHEKGLVFKFHRNPGLHKGSINLVYCNTVKTDPLDTTITMSLLTAGCYNADIDGDEMNLFLVADRYMYELFSPLIPHDTIMEPGVIGGLSGKLGLMKPLVVTLTRNIGKKEY